MDSSQRRIWGRLMVIPNLLVSVCRVRFLMRRPYCILDKRTYGPRMIWRLLALFASCFFPSAALRPSASNLRLAFSLMIANCLGLTPTVCTGHHYPSSGCDVCLCLWWRVDAWNSRSRRPLSLQSPIPCLARTLCHSSKSRPSQTLKSPKMRGLSLKPTCCRSYAGRGRFPVLQF